MNDALSVCLTCGGTPPVSGLTCICGGVGTRDAETDGLRHYLFELEKAIGTVRPALKWIRDHAPTPDAHSLAGHARVALDALSRVETRSTRLLRLFRQYQPGEQVRAVETIIYGTGEEIPEGTVGHIQRINVFGCAPLVTVAWEGRGRTGQPPSILEPCSTESLELVIFRESRESKP
jgi:hypothetical protein